VAECSTEKRSIGAPNRHQTGEGLFLSRNQHKQRGSHAKKSSIKGDRYNIGRGNDENVYWHVAKGSKEQEVKPPEKATSTDLQKWSSFRQKSDLSQNASSIWEGLGSRRSRREGYL